MQHRETLVGESLSRNKISTGIPRKSRPSCHLASLSDVKRLGTDSWRWGLVSRGRSKRDCDSRVSGAELHGKFKAHHMALDFSN